MTNRRKFITQTVLGGLGLSIGKTAGAVQPWLQSPALPPPTVVSTWNNLAANKKAWKAIKKGARALDAVEQGVRVAEADPDDMSVGYGGRPDRDGRVTLDACIMDEEGNCGSVCFLQDIRHPVSVARLVMEKTPHVMLAGDGALQFALENGFKRQNLLTSKAEKNWREWKEKSHYQPVINIENHDTIGMLGIGQDGKLSGACTTSGAAFKLHGRVGDSPIIGAGLFVDNEVGAAVATGLGEAVIKTAGSFLVVELMRQGISPQAACEEAIRRIARKQKGYEDFQVGFLALNREGGIGAYAIQPGFSYALTREGVHEVVKAASLL
ncbi:MAG: N(4)-(beta-N-acetylglucosaminyl)-L-asparaginase [Lewinellaceae bacterium]|nr:N(4)-(beta-N-acetylglucosaminyl)-L-asparaginase [Phaeodactylibacter sp.]MCB9041866.1 N(4)-(beta-N-acetylglucosaminyl)-L-asparaginase [Lewinellaceae bacterium]